MESVLLEKSVNGGVLFRSFSSSFSFDNSFPFLNTTLPSTQPPLLPLPSVNPTWKGRGMPRHQLHHKILRHASTSPRKREQRDSFSAVLVSGTVPVRSVAIPEKKNAGVLQEVVGEEVVWTGTVYSVSPPPSSVPIPRFVTVRGKNDAGKAIEKGCADGIGVDACATSELRKLLNL